MMTRSEKFLLAKFPLQEIDFQIQLERFAFRGRASPGRFAEDCISWYFRVFFPWISFD